MIAVENPSLAAGIMNVPITDDLLVLEAHKERVTDKHDHSEDLGAAKADAQLAHSSSWTVPEASKEGSSRHEPALI